MSFYAFVNKVLHAQLFGKNKDRKAKKPVPEGWHKISEPKPPVEYYHHSNPDSQGALICATVDFPSCFDPLTEELAEGYSDLMQRWNYERFKKACEFVDSGDQAWAFKLPNLSDNKLKEFAKIAFDLPVMPKHVRVDYHFDVSSGYSVPVVITIYDKAQPEAIA